MVVEVHMGETEVRNVQVHAGNSSAGNRRLDSIPGFLAEVAQPPFDGRYV